uniref:Chemokine interleukin-8-like domain-containing protein n=1 Tax=Ursus maritimus TaxID=29073 RepID=A0A452TKR7_URSMA
STDNGLILECLILLAAAVSKLKFYSSCVFATSILRCLQTLQGIHLKNIQNVKVTPSGPHCAQTEVIATLKNGQDVCLNPEAPMVRRIINKMLNK